MTGFALGSLAQVIHVTNDLAGADALYRSTFAAECFYEGYSPYERRDASLLAIGEFVIEPMAPANEDGAERYPVGRFLGRFGSHLHSIAINTRGVPALYEQLRSHSVRVVGPGGADPTTTAADAVPSIYTHPKDSHCLLEFVDFGAEVMPTSPRSRPDWDPSPWRDHPLGIDGLSHVTVAVRDLDAATAFFVDALGCPAFHEAGGAGAGAYSRFVLLGTETVVELAQPIGDHSRLARDLAANGEIVHAVTLRTVTLDRAVDHLTASFVGVAERTDDRVVLDPSDCFGAVISLTTAVLPGDPRSTRDGAAS